MTPNDRARLRAHLLETGLAGGTRTPRSNAVSHAEKLAGDDPDKHMGVGRRSRDAAGVLAAVAALCGCSAALDERDGPGNIDPERTLDGLILVGDALAEVAAARGRILIMTGHPTGVMPMYQTVARALAAAGVSLETPLDDHHLTKPRAPKRPLRLRYLDGVGVLATSGDLLHTHEAWPAERALDAIEPPDLVLADHGFAGAAIMRGLPVACFTDVNDPAIAVAWDDGLVRAVVPIDDNRPPVNYDPLAAWLVERVQTG